MAQSGYRNQRLTWLILTSILSSFFRVLLFQRERWKVGVLKWFWIHIIALSGFFFFQNNTHFQTILLVSINFKLFRKLTSWGRQTWFHCSNSSIKDSIYIKIYMELEFHNQRKMKDIKALPLLRITKEKRKKGKETQQEEQRNPASKRKTNKRRAKKPNKKSKETQQVKTKKSSK